MTLIVRQASRFLSKAQLWEDRYNRPDDVDSRPDALIHKASIAIQIQTSGRQSSWSGPACIRYGNCVHQINRPDDNPLVRTGEAFIRKLLAADMYLSERQGTTVWTRLKNRKEFREILEQLIVQLSVRTAHDYRPNNA
jgi:hypothetical protein